MDPASIKFPPYKGHCVKVSAINGAKCHMLASMLVTPAPKSKKWMDMANFSFLIESPGCNKKAIYDLAFMKDLQNRMPPALKAAMSGGEEFMTIQELRDIPETVMSQGLELASVNSIIWSHVHIDHVGDPSVFPSSTELVVGPTFKETCMPGYPVNANAFVLDSAFEGREVRELDFSNSLTTIGGFKAIDFFGDSSLWLLDTPGHTAHHISALCRTTEDSWLLLGGDVCHNIAQLRPSDYRPLPDNVPAESLGKKSPPGHCSCAHLSTLTNGEYGGAFYGLVSSMQEDLKTAEETVTKIKAFDARDDVMVLIAHDASLLDVIDFFPQPLNDWKAKGWADTGRWVFLKDFESAA